MHSKSTTPESYLATLPEDRRAIITAIRDTIRAHLPPGIEESMQYGMLGWSVSRDVYPPGYHCDPKQNVPYVSLANQKNNVSLYLFCMYTDAELTGWFQQEAQQRGFKLDMGKSCVRFKRLGDVPLDLLAETIQKMPTDAFLARYIAQIPAPKSRPKRQKSGA